MNQVLSLFEWWLGVALLAIALFAGLRRRAERFGQAHVGNDYWISAACAGLATLMFILVHAHLIVIGLVFFLFVIVISEAVITSLAK